MEVGRGGLGGVSVAILAQFWHSFGTVRGVLGHWNQTGSARQRRGFKPSDLD